MKPFKITLSAILFTATTLFAQPKESDYYPITDIPLPEGEVIDGKREVGIGDITPDIQPITRDLAAFSRNLKAVLDDKQTDDIRKTLSNVESISSQLDSIIKDVRELVEDDMKDIIISNNDRKNISEFLENLNATSKNFQKITSDNKINSTINNFNRHIT